MTSFEILPSRIRKNKKLGNKKVYIIQGEVRILKNVRLSTDDKVTLLFINGIFPESCTKRSTLIFDQGSQLSAKRMTLKAANEKYKVSKTADNGGLWFLGNYANANKDGVTVKTNRKNALSRFCALSITTNYLGRKDEYLSPKSGKMIGIGDDIDGISVLGVGPDEWNIESINSQYSADDGIDIKNSYIKLKKLKVKMPTEDGINLSSSRLEIHNVLKLNLTKTAALDRDLIDIETQDGASYLELHQGCQIDLDGVFGDELTLVSKEMPKPKLRRNNEAKYYFSGKLKKSALIFSIDQD